MAAQTANLYLVEDLGDASKTSALGNSDLAALRAVADWIRSFVARHHQDLGRGGPVCPFVPEGLEQRILWLAPEHVAGRSVPEVVQASNAYKSQFLRAQPIPGGRGLARPLGASLRKRPPPCEACAVPVGGEAGR